MSTSLSAVTVPDWEDARAHLDQHTGDDAYTLAALTAAHDADLHEFVIDPATRTVWWAYDNGPLDGKGWTVEQLTPAGAVEATEDVVSIARERLENPALYGEGPRDVDRDREVLEEYAEIVRLGL